MWYYRYSMKRYCLNCGCEQETKIIERVDTVHNAEIRCFVCDRFLGWLPKSNEQKRKAMNSEVLRKKIIEAHNFNKEFCFICNRDKLQLNKNECLTVDHIIPLEFGGRDDIENMQILCSACHQVKNWMVVYLNKHIINKNI